ncbi:hypothetical protein KUH03_13425 [Sphingobacterium sp. E70]|nr:glycoside hydrolase family 3 N-terminal domain-containing protein [Sphingobacterium sp. E70]ULT27612.1 hypothetical protein KUH03_13425 [Sphingobacterium sp. E70]
MTAYNSIDGIPCSANPWLLKDVLRKDWGFTGFVVSDLLSISGLNGDMRQPLQRRKLLRKVYMRDWMLT